MFHAAVVAVKAQLLEFGNGEVGLLLLMHADVVHVASGVAWIEINGTAIVVVGFLTVVLG